MSDNRPSPAYALVDPIDQPGAYDGISIRRIAAYLVDLLIIAGLLILYYLAVGLLTVVTLGLITPVLLFIATVIPLAYHTLLVGGSGSATLGMRLFGLEVLVWNGGKPGYLQACLHTVVFYVTTAFTGSLILLWALFNNRRRCLHDILCGTVVRRRNPG